MKIPILIAILAIILTSCTPKEEIKETKPNVILLIGDGMGVSQLSAGFYYGKGESNFKRFKHIGLINTSSASHKITDSGAGATAFSAGKRTYNGSINFDIDSLPMTIITEILADNNYINGIISTSQITHATPAAFYAKSKSRNFQEDIALQLFNSPIRFAAGGGYQYYANRSDSINYLDSFNTYDFIVDTNGFGTEKLDASKKYAFLLAPNGMPGMLDGRGDFLPQATQHALDYFSTSDNSFFIMIEGSQIDWAGHANNAEYLITEQLDFDKAVGVAMDFAEKNGNTLVIVLADHETGGFSLAAKENEEGADYNEIVPAFATKEHSASLVPVLAYGPGAEAFKGIYDNNEVFYKILELLNIQQ
jgi:alkaline phosphatase